MINSKYKINILLYHQIGNSYTPKTNLDCFCYTSNFYKQMELLHNLDDYEVISLEAALSIITNSKSINKNYVVLTFDDGCESFYNVAFPILKSFHLPASVYPITGFLDDYLNINGKVFEHLKIMSQTKIQELSRNGVHFGAHSVNHHKLTQISKSTIEYELKNSKNFLEQIIGKPIDSFSYPHGVYNEQVIDILQRTGFSNAVTCNSNSFSFNSSPFEIPRKYITFYDNLVTFQKKLY